MNNEERMKIIEQYNSKVNKLERELLDEVTKHQTAMSNDTQQAVHFFVSNEDAIVYRIKMTEKRAYRRSIIRYLEKSFPNVDVKLLNIVLIRKGYINNQEWSGVDWLFFITLGMLGLLMVIVISVGIMVSLT